MAPRALLIALALSLSAAPAFAFHCPKDMAKIDAAMKTAKLSSANKAAVLKYRKEGEKLHKAGKHQQSVDTLAKAMAVLKIK
jgi:hypothetical protein